MRRMLKDSKKNFAKDLKLTIIAMLLAVIVASFTTLAIEAKAATFSNNGVTLNINNGQALVTYNGGTNEVTRALVCRDGAVSSDGVVWLLWMSNNLYYYIPGSSTSCTLYKSNVTSISDTGYTIGTVTTPYPSKSELGGNNGSNNNGSNNNGSNNNGSNNNGSNNNGSNNNGSNNNGSNNNGSNNNGANNNNSNTTTTTTKNSVSFSGRNVTIILNGKTYTATVDSVIAEAAMDNESTVWVHTVDGGLYYWNIAIDANTVIFHKYASDCGTLVITNNLATGYYDTKGTYHKLPTLAELRNNTSTNTTNTSTNTNTVTVNGSTLTIVYNGTTYTTTISGTPVQYGWDQSGILWVLCNDGKLYAWNPKTNPNVVTLDPQANGVTMLLFNNSNPYAYVTSSGKFVLLVYKAPVAATTATKYDKYNYVVTYNTRVKLFDSNGKQKSYFDLNKGKLKYKEITRFSKKVKKAGFTNKGNIIVLLKSGKVYKLSKEDGSKVLIATGIKRLHFTNKGLVHYLVRNSGSYSDVYNR